MLTINLSERIRMASLQLGSLLALIKCAKHEQSTVSASNENGDLFKKLFELLQAEENDAASIETILKTLGESESLPVDLRFEKSERAGTDTLFPSQIPADPEENGVLFRSRLLQRLFFDITMEKNPRMQSGKESEKIEHRDTLAQFFTKVAENGKPAATPSPTPGASDFLSERLHLSNAAMQHEANILETAHRFRKATNIQELVELANKTGLNLKAVDFHREERSVSTNAEKAISLVEAYPKQSAHISTHLALLLRETDRSVHFPERPSDLKTLLTQTVVKKSARDRTIPSHTTAKTDNPLKDIMQLLSGLQHHTSKKETSAPLTEIGEGNQHRIRSADGTAGRIPVPEAASESIDIVHAEPTPSNERLTQKIVDAKATLRHFAQRLHEQVETYKPPFSRMQLSLDPKELGSVEVTLISRGSNLHIQVHSNPTAIGIMATQGQELKNQLVSMGFTDVQMQFNMNQQQQRQKYHDSKTGGRYVELEEIPDFYESLDLIIPQYV